MNSFGINRDEVAVSIPQVTASWGPLLSWLSPVAALSTCEEVLIQREMHFKV